MTGEYCSHTCRGWGYGRAGPSGYSVRGLTGEHGSRLEEIKVGKSLKPRSGEKNHSSCFGHDAMMSEAPPTRPVPLLLVKI